MTKEECPGCGEQTYERHRELDVGQFWRCLNCGTVGPEPAPGIKLPSDVIEAAGQLARHISDPSRDRPVLVIAGLGKGRRRCAGVKVGEKTA